MSTTIYTDGSCPPPKGNPGGWAFIVLNEKLEELYSETGGSLSTSNNEMEMQAVLAAVSSRNDEVVTIRTDSKNVIGWCHGFNLASNRPDSAKPYKLDKSSTELKRLRSEIVDTIKRNNLQVIWELVKGHSTDKWNATVDEMAVTMRKRMQSHRNAIPKTFDSEILVGVPE